MRAAVGLGGFCGFGRLSDCKAVLRAEGVREASNGALQSRKCRSERISHSLRRRVDSRNNNKSPVLKTGDLLG